MIALAHERPFTVQAEAYPSILVRLLVLSFFPLYQFGPALMETTGLKPWLFLFVAPTAGYITLRMASAVRFGALIPGFWSIAGILLYAFTYSVLYFPRAQSNFVLASNLPALCLTVLFWHFAYSSSAYRGRPDRFFSDLWMSLVVGVVTGMVVAWSVVGFNLTPGSVHNLGEISPMVRSDLDVPVFALALGVVGVVHVWKRERLRPSLSAVTWVRVRSASYGAALLALSVFTLFMYGRRTPLIAMAIVGVILTLSLRWSLRSLYGVFLLPAIPLFWNIASRILIAITQNPIVAALFVRNDPETYLTATNRLGIWLKALAYLLNFRVQHLWGYGGAPAEVLLGSRQWTHVHNTAMQLVFDAGLISLALAAFVLIQTYRRLVVLVQFGTYRGEALALFAVFVAWLVISGVEPMMRSVSGGHLVGLVIMVAVANLYRDTTPSPLGSKTIVLPIPRRTVAALPIS